MPPESKRPVVEGEGIPGDAVRAEARERVARMVLVLSALCGVLMAVCISLMVRLDSGYPPALKAQPFAALLEMPAPGLSLPGLDGETVTLPHPGAPGSRREAGLLADLLHRQRVQGLRCGLSFGQAGGGKTPRLRGRRRVESGTEAQARRSRNSGRCRVRQPLVRGSRLRRGSGSQRPARRRGRDCQGRGERHRLRGAGVGEIAGAAKGGLMNLYDDPVFLTEVAMLSALLFAGLYLSHLDFETRRVPNRYVLGLVLAGVAGQALMVHLEVVTAGRVLANAGTAVVIAGATAVVSSLGFGRRQVLLRGRWWLCRLPFRRGRRRCRCRRRPGPCFSTCWPVTCWCFFSSLCAGACGVGRGNSNRRGCGRRPRPRCGSPGFWA